MTVNFIDFLYKLPEKPRTFTKYHQKDQLALRYCFYDLKGVYSKTIGLLNS